MVCLSCVSYRSGWPGPEREDQDAAGGAKGETGVCSSVTVCSVYRKSEEVPSCSYHVMIVVIADTVRWLKYAK